MADPPRELANKSPLIIYSSTKKAPDWVPFVCINDTYLFSSKSLPGIPGAVIWKGSRMCSISASVSRFS